MRFSGTLVEFILAFAAVLETLSIVHASDCTTPSFAPTMSFPVGSDSASLTTGDFNNDDWIDLAVANWGTSTGPANGSISVLIGNGDGSFRPATNYAAGSVLFCVATGDFSRDGKLDLVTGGSSGTWIMLGNGDGSFQIATLVEARPGVAYIVIGDFNRDGKADVMTANYISGERSNLLS